MSPDLTAALVAEEARIEAAYARREDRGRYSWFDPAYVLVMQDVERRLLDRLRTVADVHGPRDYWIDERLRTVPDHYHAHARRRVRTRRHDPWRTPCPERTASHRPAYRSTSSTAAASSMPYFWHSSSFRRGSGLASPPQPDQNIATAPL